MNKTVTVVDYGSNNLRSIAHAFEASGANVKIVNNPKDVKSSDRLVLPGVGAFPEGKRNLVDSGMFDELLQYAQKDRPLLGICLGMQMLSTRSSEFGSTSGLNLIPGLVEIIPEKDIYGGRLKRPHIGWAKIYRGQELSWDPSILRTVPIGAEFYMVHSFHLVPEEIKHVLAITKYGGHNITAAIQNGYIFGCQFHPEKSGIWGLNVLKGFLEI